MSNFDCPNCDDPACNVAELRHRVRTKKLNTVALTSLASEYNRAKDACQSKTVNWRARALAAELRIRECAASLADIEREDPDSLDDYHKGFRHGCQDMIAILCGEP